MASPVTHETNIANGTNVSPVSFSTATVQTSYVAILLVYNEHAGSPGATTTVTSTTGHTWTLRKRSNASTSGCLELYWAAGTTTPINCTITFSGAYDDYAAVLAVVSGCNPVAPFDANAGLPAAHSSTTTTWTPSFTGVNTSSANDLLLFLTGQASGHGTPATGFSNIVFTGSGGGSWASGAAIDAQSVSVAQSGATFTLGSTTGGFGSAGEAIFDALTSVASGNAYSLAAAEGTYALAGQNQPFISASRSLAAAEGSYALAGRGAGLTRVNNHGIYALAGQPIILNHGYSLAAASGTYTLSGQAQHFGRSRPAASGSYTLTGEAITTPHHLSLQAASGTYLRVGFSGTVLLKVPGGPDSGNTPQHSNMFRSDVGQLKTQ